MWSIAALPLGIYVIVQDLNVPLIVQPQLFALFSLLSWIQCMYYGHARSRAWCVVVVASTLVLYGAFETGMVFALRVRYAPCFFPRPNCYISPHTGAARLRPKPACASLGY
jgi:hypothetical protein